MSQHDTLTLEQTLLECKRWHQGDKWREGTPEQRECWSKQMANIDTALAALSATQPAQAAPVVPDGYALISVDALRAWGKLDEVQAACVYPASGRKPAQAAQGEPVERVWTVQTAHCLAGEVTLSTSDKPVALCDLQAGDIVRIVKDRQAACNAVAQGAGEVAADPAVDAFLADVRAEIIRARTKFPGARIMTIALAEEFGELVKAVLDESSANVRKEAVQTATMCARVVLDGDDSVNEWRSQRGLDQLTADRTPAPTQPAAGADVGDTALLDWLAQHDGEFFNYDRIACIVGTGFFIANYPKDKHASLRAAIRAAIAASGRQS